MHWIESDDLRKWADRRDCQETLPQLIRKLIRASAPQGTLQSARFPAGDNVALHGWDGVVELTATVEFIPEGSSVWEFGCDKIPSAKADKDYDKRKANPQVDDPSKTTYVFVTPRVWEKKDKWISEKKKDNIWKEIIVLDCVSLEEWLEKNPSVAAWLATIHLNKYPHGIEATDVYWDRWASGPKVLIPELLTGGRNDQVKMLLDRSSGPGILIGVRGRSRDESIAFIVSVFKQNCDRSEDFFSRSLVVDSIETFRELSIHPDPLILIPRFADSSSFHYATAKGHVVIVPLDANAENQDIQLPPIERDSFINALMKIGFSEEQARKLSKESMRNPTILKRILKYDKTVPDWAKPEHGREIIPALLMNRWDIGYENDKTVVQILSGESYEIYEKKLSRWVNSPDAPIVRFGQHWRLTSSLDCWTYAAQFVTRGDLENLKTAILKTFAEIDPSLELPADKRYMAGLYNKRRSYSRWIREGQLQSLILISVFGDRLNLDLPTTGPLWSDMIVRELLNNSDKDYWKSIEHHLPLIAEASPTEFLNTLEKLVVVENSPIVALFDERANVFYTSAYHVSLLWALESVAWLPEYLSRASLLLARLTAIDPGGKLANRPNRSLIEIFKSWHPQTLATVKERLDVLELLLKKEGTIVWKLLPSLLPHSHGVAEYTHTMRWRAFEECFRKSVPSKEIDEFCNGIVELLLKYFDFSEEQLVVLLATSTELSASDWNKVMDFIEGNLSKVNHPKNLSWHKLRSIISHHRSHPDSDWSLPESTLVRLEHLYKALTPKDVFEQHIWWFNESWPAILDGWEHRKKSHDEREALLNAYRNDTAKILLEQCGLERLLEVSSIVQEPFALGYSLANIIEDEVRIHQVLRNISGDGGQTTLAQGFTIGKHRSYGLSWLFDWHNKIAKAIDPKYQFKLFTSIPPSQELWTYVDGLDPILSRNYWTNCRPHYYRNSPAERVYGIKRLIDHARFITAAEIASRFAAELSTELIVELLLKMATTKANDKHVLSTYQLTDLFEELDKRHDIERRTLIQLEWYYLGLLTDVGSCRKPDLLHDELSKSPEFFVDVLKLVYRPEAEEKITEELKGLSLEQLQARAMQAYKLLDSWKSLPGCDEHGNINRETLNTWIDRSRDLSALCGRDGKADIYIGKLFAVIPEVANLHWPPIEIAEIIERINTQSLKQAFSSGIFNRRGTFSKAVHEGGLQERNIADHFEQLARANANSFPNVAGVLSDLARGYRADAKREDENAAKSDSEY